MTNGQGAKGHHASLGVANLLLAKVLRAPLWLVLSATLARVLGPEGLGTWSMLLAAAMFLNQSLLHWTQSITQRFGRREWLDSGEFDRTFAKRWPLLLPGFVLLVASLAWRPMAWPERFYGLNDQVVWFVLPMVLNLWLMAEVQGVQQVRERYLRLAWSPLVTDLLTLSVLAAWVGVVGIGGEHQMIYLVLTATGLVAWLAWLASELRGTGFRLALPLQGEVAVAAAFAAPMIPGFLIGYLSEWGDYFLIRHFYSETEVGYFHPAYQYLLILVGLPTALASVILPKLVAAHDRDGGAWLRTLLTRHAAQFGVLWGIAGLSASAVLPALFGWLVGEDYPVSGSMLQVMAIAIPGAIVQHIYSAVCFAQNRLGMANLFFFGIKIIANLGISILLLPRVGAVGSAVGCAVSYLILQWLFVLDQQRLLKIRFGNAGRSLLFSQLAGIILTFADGLAARIFLALLTGGLLVAWARAAGLFSSDEILTMLPPRAKALARPLQRLLCRDN